MSKSINSIKNSETLNRSFEYDGPHQNPLQQFPNNYFAALRRMVLPQRKNKYVSVNDKSARVYLRAATAKQRKMA